jgi:hypothetical protein
MNNVEIALLVWLTYPVLMSLSKGITYASLSFARGEVDEGLQIIMRIPQAVLHLAVWPYTSTVGAVLSALAYDRYIQAFKKETDNGNPKG